MAQGRSTEIISMIQWIRTSRLSIKNYLSCRTVAPKRRAVEGRVAVQRRAVHVRALSQTMYQLNGFSKANPPTKPSTYCSLLLIKQ